MTKEQFIHQVAQSQESLRRFLLVLCAGDGFRADDIAQEALLKAYMSFGRFEGRAKFSTWLFRIAYNCFYDLQKKSGKMETEPLPENRNAAHDGCHGAVRDVAYVDTTEAADKMYEYQQLYLAIDALSGPEKVVTLLFYMEEKSIKEIEQITDMPSGTVRSHLSRARAHLREHLSSGKI